ncbi:hypothetical protein [Capillimicrobium parvum]|uniref:hypothetical protein n=1 Tax=Capillimicrobium parvum TaxID=2884022 RepID=UPI00216B4C91|nr:hypothetical protein [Capillimicrobium parvum]
MRRRVYTEHDQAEALMMLAVCRGNAEEARRRMKARGDDPPPASTLNMWRTAQADRYEDIRSEISVKITAEVANQAEEIMLEAGELEREMLARIREELPNIKPGELPGALRNVTTTKALNNDKIAGPIRGRPTVITEHRDATQILAELQRLGVIDSTAEEISALPPAA